MDNNFENEVKNRLQWSFKDWQAEGVHGNAMKRLVNSLKFWFSRLKNAMKENNVILTLFHESTRAYPKLQKITDALYNLNSNISIKGYAKFKNKRYISLSFADVDTKNFVMENLTRIDNQQIAYLHWVQEAVQGALSVHWLSDETHLDLIVDFVSQYMDIKFVQRQTTALANGEMCVLGTVLFRGEFKRHVEVDDIPHFGVIDGLECLIVVEGRPHKCYNCYNIGHKASKCAKAYCSRCKKMLNKIHICENVSLNESFQYNEKDNFDSLNKLEDSIISMDTDQAIGGNEGIITKNLFLDNELSFGNAQDEFYTAAAGLECLNISGPNLNIVEHNKNKETQATGTINKTKFGFAGFVEYKDLNRNTFITEECNLGDPNFILIDTSSSESDSSGENINNFGEVLDGCIAYFSYQAEISRSLLQSSLPLLKLNTQNVAIASEGFNAKFPMNLLEKKSVVPQIVSVDKMEYIEPMTSFQEEIKHTDNHVMTKKKKRRKNKKK